MPANHAHSQYTVQGPPSVFTSCTLLARQQPHVLHHRHRPILTSSPSYDPYIIGIALALTSSPSPRPFPPTHLARGPFSARQHLPIPTPPWHTGHLRLRKVVLGTGHLRHFRAISAEGGALNGTPSALSRTAHTPFTATTQTKRPCPCFRHIEICPLHGAGFDGGNDLRKESAPGAHLSFIQIHIEETGRWAENQDPVFKQWIREVYQSL